MLMSSSSWYKKILVSNPPMRSKSSFLAKSAAPESMGTSLGSRGVPRGIICSAFRRQLRRLNESFPWLLRMRGLKQEASGWVSAADSSSAIVEGSSMLSGLIKKRNSLLQRLAP